MCAPELQGPSTSGKNGASVAKRRHVPDGRSLATMASGECNWHDDLPASPFMRARPARKVSCNRRATGKSSRSSADGFWTEKSRSSLLRNAAPMFDFVSLWLIRTKTSGLPITTKSQPLGDSSIIWLCEVHHHPLRTMRRIIKNDLKAWSIVTPGIMW